MRMESAGLSVATQDMRYELMTVERENREMKQVREPWEGFKSARCITVPKENYYAQKENDDD